MPVKPRVIASRHPKLLNKQSIKGQKPPFRLLTISAGFFKSLFAFPVQSCVRFCRRLSRVIFSVFQKFRHVELTCGSLCGLIQLFLSGERVELTVELRCELIFKIADTL